jgi:hypothetical protein
MLEHRYNVVSREKRQRLQAGKGVKKSGMYIHDRAASFESLPPGPDPKSVAVDIHAYLPKLTKRATLFRQNQQTIDQRQMEFVALIKAFFEEEVPALIKELRRDRIILDFFGYWRRDYDLASKERAKRSKTGASGTFETSPISMFSQSSLSLSLTSPSTTSFTTQRPRTTSSARSRPRTTESVVSLSDTESAFSRFSRILPRRSPSSTPRVGSTFQDNAHSEDEQTLRRTTVASSSNGPSPLSQASFPDNTSSLSRRPSSSHGSKASSHGSKASSQGSKTSSSTRTDTFNVASDFPLFLSSSTRDIIPSSRPPQSPTYSASGLGTLPEDSELGSPTSSLPPPTPRNRKDAGTDRAFRNCIIWNDNDEASSTEDRELHVSVDNSVLKETVTKYTSSSSLPSSISLSNFSPQSRRSSWRTSSEMAWPASPSSAGSPLDPDFPHWVGADSHTKPASSVPLIPTADGNDSTKSRSLPGRPRSHSQPLAHNVSVPVEVGDGGWSDFGEDFIDTYFGGSGSFSVPSDDGIPRDEDVDSNDLPLDVGEDPADRNSFYYAGVPAAHQGHEPVDVVFPLTVTTARGSQQRSPSPQSPSAATPTLQGVPLGSQMVTVKAVLDNSIVVFRVRRDTPLADLRRRVHDKFVRTEGIALHGAFALAYVIPVDSKGARRVSSMSSDSSARAMPIQDEEDWANAVAECGLKITLRIYYLS